MIVNTTEVNNEFTDKHGAEVKITDIHEEDGESISFCVIRISGHLKGSSYIYSAKKTEDGKINLKNCSNFKPKKAED